MPLSSLYTKLIGGLVVALLLLGLVADRSRWMHRAHSAEAENATVCASVRAASNNPKLDCKSAAQQVGLLGQAVADLKAGLAKQNAAVGEMAAESERQRQNAVQAAEKARQRANGVQDAANRLIASSRSGERLNKPCEPSKALEGTWK
jgi:molecular chaperone GrpE (heat shock protein)